MEFKKYSSIEGIWNQKNLEYYRLKGIFENNELWNVTEKIHGSNLSIYITKDTFEIARRNNFLKDDEFFFGCRDTIEKIKSKLTNVFGLLYMCFECKELIIYGELCGGAYPHKDVPSVSCTKIQKGVYYSSDLQYYIFDIMMDGKFMNMILLSKICETLDLLYARILFQGTFEECLAYPNKFQTNIPIWLGLPPIEDNICEGIVIKPKKERTDSKIGRVQLKLVSNRYYQEG